MAVLTNGRARVLCAVASLAMALLAGAEARAEGSSGDASGLDTPDAAASGLRLDAHGFVFSRISSEHSSALYGGFAFGPHGGTFAALVKNPRSGYREAIGGVFTRLAAGRGDLSLALAYADASDGRYLQLYLSPSFEAGPWSLSGTLEIYQPVGRLGVRQMYLDPLSLLRAAGPGWQLGAAYALGVSAGDGPQHRAGPAARFAWAGGAVRAEVLHDFGKGSNDVRLIYQRGF